MCVCVCVCVCVVTSAYGPFYSDGRSAGTHQIWGCVGPRRDVDAEKLFHVRNRTRKLQTLRKTFVATIIKSTVVDICLRSIPTDPLYCTYPLRFKHSLKTHRDKIILTHLFTFVHLENSREIHTAFFKLHKNSLGLLGGGGGQRFVLFIRKSAPWWRRKSRLSKRLFCFFFFRRLTNLHGW